MVKLIQLLAVIVVVICTLSIPSSHAKHHRHKRKCTTKCTRSSCPVPAAKRKSIRSKEAPAANKLNPKLQYPAPGSGGEEINHWFMRNRALPGDEIDPEAYPKALEQANRMPYLQQSGFNSTQSLSSWKMIGPTTLGGRVTTIAVHPTDSNTFWIGAASGGLWKTTDHGVTWRCLTDTFGMLSVGTVAVNPKNPDILYLGMGECNESGDSYPGNGLYKTTDGGTTWNSIGFTKSQFIAKIAFDLNHPDTLFVAILGPRNLRDTNRGVFKSVDGGINWTRSLFVRRLPKTRSTDCISFIDLAMNPDNPNDLAAFAWDKSGGAGLSGSNSAVWLTKDGGANWRRMDTVSGSGLPPAKLGTLSRGALTWTAGNGENTLYAAYTHAAANVVTHYLTDVNFFGLYRSTDEGEHWQIVLDSSTRIPMNGLLGLDSADILYRQGSYNLYLAGNPHNPNEVYLGGIDIFRSSDRGKTFTDIAKAYGDYYQKNRREQHSDQHGLAFTSGTNDLLAVSDGGVYNTKDFGTTWQQMKGLPITMFYTVEPWRGYLNQHTGALMDINDIRLMGGTQDNGTTEHGLTDTSDWSWINKGDGTVAISNPTDPARMITSLQLGGIYMRSTLDSLRPNSVSDYDTTLESVRKWHPISLLLRKLTDTTESVSFVAPIVLDDLHPSELYTAREHVYKAVIDYTNARNTKWYRWSPTIGGDTTDFHHWYYGTIDALAIGPHDAAGNPMLWAGGFVQLAPSSAVWRTTVNVARSADSAPHWILVNNGLSGAYISSITPDRSDSLTAFITTLSAAPDDSSHVLKTTDGGAHWQNISGSLPHTPVNALVIDTLAEQGNASFKNYCIIVATDVGVFGTLDGGVHWGLLAPGMPHLIVSDIKLYKNILIAGTHGRSAYAIDVRDLRAQLAAVAQQKTSTQEISVYPNPVRSVENGFTIHTPLTGDAAANYRIEIIQEATGVLVATQLSSSNSENLHVNLPPATPSGNYIIRLLAGNTAISTTRITIVK